MEIAVTILSILFGTETLGFISFLIFLKLNKREKTTQVEQQEINTQKEVLDLGSIYLQKIKELDEEKTMYYESQKKDMEFVKKLLNEIVAFLDGDFVAFQKRLQYVNNESYIKETAQV